MRKGRGGIYAAMAAIVGTVGLGAVGAAGADRAANANVYAHDAGGPPRCFSESDTQCDAAAADVEINTGESVTWHFVGVENHNAASSNAVPADPAWEAYAGDVVSTGSYSRQFNQPGTYEFFCQVHPTMTGTIRVVGQPVPTVSATSTSTATASATATTQPSGPITPPPSASSDTLAPKVSSVRPKALRRAVRVRFRLSEPATVTVRVKRGGKLIKSKRVQAAAGTRSVTLRSKRLKKGRYTVEVIARDTAGNRSLLASKRVKLRK